MTVKATLSFTDRHHQFPFGKGGAGRVRDPERRSRGRSGEMMQDEQERDVALSAHVQEIRARMETLREAFID